MEQALSPLHSVFVPVLSRIQSQPERYRRTFLRVYEAMALVSCLTAGLLFALARPLTLVVLGGKWEQASIIFASLTIAAFIMPLGTASTWLFISQGRGRDWSVSSLLGSITIVVSFVTGLPFGPVGVAIAYSTIGLFIGMPLLYYLAGRVGKAFFASCRFGSLYVAWHGWYASFSWTPHHYCNYSSAPPLAFLLERP